MRSEDFGYGVLSATNDSVAVFEQRRNEGDGLVDRFVVTRRDGLRSRSFKADDDTVDRIARLLRVKKAVDARGLFVCRHCVGSEGWSDDGNCRVEP